MNTPLTYKELSKIVSEAELFKGEYDMFEATVDESGISFAYCPTSEYSNGFTLTEANTKASINSEGDLCISYKDIKFLLTPLYRKGAV